jgi:hypothetical protein
MVPIQGAASSIAKGTPSARAQIVSTWINSPLLGSKAGLCAQAW